MYKQYIQRLINSNPAVGDAQTQDLIDMMWDLRQDFMEYDRGEASALGVSEEWMKRFVEHMQKFYGIST